MIKPPCARDCPRRCPGCGAGCDAWAEYVRQRDEEYRKRAEILSINHAVQDGYARVARTHGGKH